MTNEETKNKWVMRGLRITPRQNDIVKELMAVDGYPSFSSLFQAMLVEFYQKRKNK